MATFEGLLIFCADVPAAARFYQDGLGFEQDWADDAHIQFHLPTAGDPRGGWLLLHPQTDPPNRPHPLGTFAVADVDAVLDRLRAAGHRVVAEPQDEPWGVRQASVLDADGYGINLSAPLKPSSRTSDPTG